MFLYSSFPIIFFLIQFQCDVTEEDLQLAYINNLIWNNLTITEELSHRSAMDSILVNLVLRL